MNRKNLTLISRIEREIADIELLVEKIQKGWEKTKQNEESFFLDSVALNLHGFYSALERIFITIAREIDGFVPAGVSWHHELLFQMQTEIKKIRPPVISPDTCSRLGEYRGFRHIVRNVYSFNLSISRIEPLVDELPLLFEHIKEELLLFTRLIEENS